MTPFFVLFAGFGSYLCAISGFQFISLTQTRPFYVPEPPSGRVVAGVLSWTFLQMVMVMVMVLVMVVVMAMVAVMVGWLVGWWVGGLVD